jgi:hypothetical protein
LATDAAFAYDGAYRLFGVKVAQKKVSATTPYNNDVESDPFDSEEANFVFNWLSYPDEAMMEVESPERMNFTCPSDYRRKRSEELASRLLMSPQEPIDAEGLKGLGIISEADLVAKVRKEVISIAKLAAAICPVQRIFGKRACDLTFDELPEVELKSRKRSRKPSREYLLKRHYEQQQQQQQLSNTTSNMPLQQMLLQQQMFGQAMMMGAHIGYNSMFGALPMGTLGPPPPSSHNSLLGYPRERAAMPNELSSSSSPALNPGLPPSGSTYDPQLFYLMMQRNMPHPNMLSMNEQLRSRNLQADMPQGNMVSINRAPQVDVPYTNEQPCTSSPQAAYQNKQVSINNNQMLLLPSRKSHPSPETKK